MNITDKLMDEHQLILRYIDLLGHYLAVLRRDEKRLDLFSQLLHFVDFVRNYADRYHHAKEENILFKYLERPGVLTHCNPLPVMLEEHDSGRYFIGELIDAFEKQEVQRAVNNGLSWMRLLQDHINKEDNVLYMMAEEGLSDDLKQMIAAEYAEVEKTMGGVALEQKYQELYRSLAEKV